MACQRTAIFLSTLINSAMLLSNCNESSLRSCSALWETNPKWCRFAEAPDVRHDHAGWVHSLPDSFTMRHALGNNGTVSGRAPLGARPLPTPPPHDPRPHLQRRPLKQIPFRKCHGKTFPCTRCRSLLIRWPRRLESLWLSAEKLAAKCVRGWE